MNKKVIFDTEIGPHIGEAAALSMLHIMANQKKLEPLAVMLNSTQRDGVPLINIFNSYFNDTLPIGALTDGHFCDFSMNRRYSRFVIDEFGDSYPKPEVTDYVTLYRRILSKQPDKSVTIVCTGPHRGLKKLMLSEPDAYSALKGSELIYKKVFRLIIASGVFVDQRDPERTGNYREGWDIWSHSEVDMYSSWDPEALVYINNKWPTEVLWCGFETAFCIPSGERFCRKAPDSHPLKVAYKNFNKNRNDFSGIQVAMLAACPEYEAALCFSEPGKVLMDQKGRTMFFKGSGIRDRILRNDPKACEAAAEMIEDILTQCC